MRCYAGFAALAIVSLGPAAAAEAQTADLSGKYLMEGRQDGRTSPPYRGECDLKRASSYYNVFCVNGDDKYTGKGVVSGNIFSLYLGEYLVVYQIGGSGTLEGAWVHAASDATGKETLTPKRP